MGQLGAYAAPGVVGDAHIWARTQLTPSWCGVILGRISRLGCGPAGNPHTREAEEGNLRWRTKKWDGDAVALGNLGLVGNPQDSFSHHHVTTRLSLSLKSVQI